MKVIKLVRCVGRPEPLCDRARTLTVEFDCREEHIVNEIGEPIHGSAQWLFDNVAATLA